MEQHTQVIDPQVADPTITDATVTDAQIPAQPVRDLAGSSLAETHGADRAGMELLAAHVPLTLLLDLAGNDRPESREILLHERPSADELAWIGSR
jgi:hypothetical protein